MHSQVIIIISITTLIISGMISLIILTYIFIESKKDNKVTYFIILQAIIIIGSFLYILELLSPNFTTMWTLRKIQYFNACFISIVFLLFSYAYTQEKRLKTKYVILLFIPHTLCLISVITNEYHYIFYKKISMEQTEYGIICFLHILISYAYILLGLYFFLKCKKKCSIQQKTIVIVATLIPLITHLIYINNTNHFQIVITHLILPLSSITIGIGILKYHVLHLSPYIMNNLFDSVQDSILVINENNKIEDYNKKLLRTFSINVNKCDSFKDFIDIVSCIVKEEKMINEINNMVYSNAENKSGELIVEMNNIEMVLSYRISNVFNKDRTKKATIIIFDDITNFKHLVQKIERKNEELEVANKKLNNHLKNIELLTIERERSKLMIEINNTIGNTITELLALLEICNLFITRNKNTDEITAIIDDALVRARNGLNEIRSSVKKYKKVEGAV